MNFSIQNFLEYLQNNPMTPNQELVCSLDYIQSIKTFYYVGNGNDFGVVVYNDDNTTRDFTHGSFTSAAGDVINGDLFRLLAGDPSAGVFMTGFFPVMMFGLPGAALAMYLTAKPEKRGCTTEKRDSYDPAGEPSVGPESGRDRRDRPGVTCIRVQGRSFQG